MLALASAPAQATGPWAGACTASKLPVLKNGSFENGVNPPSFDLRTLQATRTTPNADIASWLVRPAFNNAKGSLDWNQRFQASDGERTVDLNGLSSTGAIEQAIQNLVAGKIDLLAFDLAGNPEGPPTVKRLRVDIDGSRYYYEFDTTGQSTTDMGYVTKYIAFKHTGHSPVLRFTALEPNVDTSSYGAFIDNVKIACVS